MSDLTVVTGWNPKGYETYGRRFADSFHRHWPKDVKLIVYGEEPVALPRGEFRRLSEIPGCTEFIARHAHNLAAQGKAPTEKWKERAIAQGYNWRFDAWKFCRQGFIPWHAAQTCETEYLAWLDGDVVTFKDIPEGYIEGLLPKGKLVAYFGRHPKHSEIGFQLYRLPIGRAVLNVFKNMYDSDEVFKLKEWHSAYVFDFAVGRFPSAGHDLTPGGTGAVWNVSPIRKYTDHLKGDRKFKGAVHA